MVSVLYTTKDIGLPGAWKWKRDSCWSPFSGYRCCFSCWTWGTDSSTVLPETDTEAPPAERNIGAEAPAPPASEAAHAMGEEAQEGDRAYAAAMEAYVATFETEL